MPKSHYDNHERAEELHDGAAHSHRVGEQKGKQDHLTGHELSRQAHEHSEDNHQAPPSATAAHGIAAFGHSEIAALAHKYWLDRGCPAGSPEVDWFHAVEELRSRNLAQ